MVSTDDRGVILQEGFIFETKNYGYGLKKNESGKQRISSPGESRTRDILRVKQTW